MSARLLGLLLTAALLAAPAAQAGCQLRAVASLPMKEIGGRVFIPGAIGQHPVDFLVDLAAPTTLLQAAARDFGITPDMLHALDHEAVLGTGGGDVTLAGADQPIPSTLVIQNMPLRIRGTVANLGERDAVAILGLDLLAQYDIEFDPVRKAINLFQSDGCRQAWLGYWDKHAAHADMIANITQHPNDPFYTDYNFPNIMLRATVDGRAIKAAFDSGEARTVLSLTAAHELGVERRGDPQFRERDLWDGREADVWLASVGSVALGDETLTPAVLGVRGFHGWGTGPGMAMSRETGAEMILGADFLLTHRVLVSYSQNKVYFSPAEGQTFLGATPILPAGVSSR